MPGSNRWPACAAMVIALLAVCGVAMAQATRPATGLYENESIRRSQLSATASTTQRTTAQPSRDFLDLRRLGGALALVLGLIFLVRWIGRRYFPALAGGKSHDAIRVLARSALTPKQHVLLVQVGRRVLVVADNGTQMSPLSEITDTDEIAQLVGQVTGNRAAEVFGAEFSKAQDDFVAAAAPIPPQLHADVEPDHGPMVAATSGEIEGLMQKVRGLAKQLGR